MSFAQSEETAVRPASGPDLFAAGGVYAEGLVKVYAGDVTAISDVSLRAETGEVVGVLGPNGAGKSTTLKILTTLLRPTRGRAAVLGFDVLDVERVRPLLGVALQDVGLDPLMSGRQHFTVQAALYGVPLSALRARCEAIVERFALGAYLDRNVGFYSGGTQRKLALALALIADPPVVVFDEPTAGLDPHSRRQVWDLVHELRDQGKVVLFSTQYMEEADRLADRLYVIDRGRIVAEGSPAELKGMVGAGTLRVVVEASPSKLRATIAGSTALSEADMEEDGDALLVKVGRGSSLPIAVLEAIQAGNLELREFTFSPPTLEDTFLHLTGRVLEPEPLVQPTMDMGSRMHRGGGSRWR